MSHAYLFIRDPAANGLGFGLGDGDGHSLLGSQQGADSEKGIGDGELHFDEVPVLEKVGYVEICWQRYLDRFGSV